MEKICFVLRSSSLTIEADEEMRELEWTTMFSEFNQALKKVQDSVISYTVITGVELGFPILKPCNTMLYRIDYAIGDIDSVLSGKAKTIREEEKRGWQGLSSLSPDELPEAKLNMIRGILFAPARDFFGTENIVRWTTELDSLNALDPDFQNQDKDNRGCANKFSKEAFLSLIYGAGYLMARFVIKEDQLGVLNQLGEQYIVREI